MGLELEMLILLLPLLHVIQCTSSQQYYYEPHPEAREYYNSADHSFHTRGIPHTKDNSMRALADIITPRPTDQRPPPRTTTEHQPQDTYLGFYYDEEEPIANGSDFSPSIYGPHDRFADFYGNTPMRNYYYYFDEEASPNVDEATRTSEVTHHTTNSPTVTSSRPNQVPDNTTFYSTFSSYTNGTNTTENSSLVVNTTTKHHLSHTNYFQSVSNSTYGTDQAFSTDEYPDLNYGDVIGCDLDTQSGCDVIHNERCDVKTRTCRCLNGYIRSVEEAAGSCKAASFFHGHVTMRLASRKHNPKLSSQQLDSVKKELLQKIRHLFQKRSVPEVLDVSINFYEMRNQDLSLSFDLALAKESLPTSDNVDTLWKDLVPLYSARHLQSSPATHNVTANIRDDGLGLFSPLVEINQCARQAYHYCSPLAQCLYDSSKVTCRCQPGFEDAASDLHRLPGELCVEKCRCKNGGICLEADADQGTKQCSCVGWYLGKECQIDGKELLVICSCCLGSLIVLATSLCCCYHACAKHKEKAAKSRLFHFTPEPNILKLPRVWMETPSFHDDLSPQNPRRMSMASGADCNEYFGGFILEDLTGTNMQRHTDALSSYYQTTANLCGVPASSQQSLYRY